MALLTLARRSQVLVTAFVCLAIARAAAGQAQPTAIEASVKAVFLYNFTKYVTWPAVVIGERSPAEVRICVTADDEFFDLLKSAVQGEAIDGKPLLPVALTGLDEARTCQILYVGDGRTADARAWLNAVRDTQVLTVADGALPDEPVIAFVRDDNRLRFDINRAAAGRHGLNVSAKLLRLARQVRERVVMFNRLSIKQKLTAMLMIASATVLLLASAAFVAWDFYRFRADMRVDLSTQAGLVLDNTAAAVTFNDPEAARETLAMLSINPHVQIACLYLPTGALFAVANFHDVTADHCPEAVSPGSTVFTANRLQVTERLERGTDQGSTLFIASDLDAHRARIRTQATAVAAILVAGLLLAFLLASSLQTIVAHPVAALAATARDIADRGDYSIRATRSTRDEIGVLVQAFNGMLDEIESSQRDRAELLVREQQANRLKDEFLATLSHELRTPLNAIVGWVHLLRRGQLPAEEARHALERIDRNAHAQARLVQDLLDVSRITTGKLMLDVREIDLTVVAANAIDACRPAADARQVTLVTQFYGAFLTMGDPDRLQQVVWNLITNAVRFTPAQGRVTVSLSRAGMVDTLQVSDTGAGIDPDFAPYIFEPFRQADAASTRTHGGLGIGLTIVRRLTEMHGGTVSAHSGGPGKGATFTVALPVRLPAATAVLSLLPRGRVGSLAEATVLVVEDDADTLELLESTLRMAGAKPVGAGSVAEAMRLIDGVALDALISDIAMPGQDGYTLITLLRDRLGKGMPLATVALTAYASAADRARALDAGFREHLSKPVNPDILLQTLEDLLAEGAARAT